MGLGVTRPTPLEESVVLKGEATHWRLPTGAPLTPTNTSEGGPPDGIPQDGGLSVGAIAGIAVGAIIAIAVIIVLIVVFVVKPDCIGGSGSRVSSCPNPDRPPKTTSHKHSTSAVGSSNGNEKNDVEAPLNGVNEVITQEKIKPEAAPRGHSSIKHTTDNPDQAEYAMVDRRQGGRGDTTDARGNGAGQRGATNAGYQNEQPGMHYADLDLTSGAGHSDRVVPKNEDGVVVYSSILV
ncbi:uncharacterized protein LOC129267299 [Lytechinus pictus]|uniref:uncharacterized protein LOC129267299 n=1 Tax=Lytechinus pictus TaxID=7653 RepID=UPI0030BA2A80